MSAVVEKVTQSNQQGVETPKKNVVSPSDEQTFNEAAEGAEGEETPEELSSDSLPIVSRAAVEDDPETVPFEAPIRATEKDEPPEYKLDSQAYDNHLNAVVAKMVDSVEGRSLYGLNGGGNADHYKAMVEYKLHEQAKNGENVSLDKAYREVEEEIRGRYGLAADNYDDKDHRLDVLEGYWDRQNGHDDAKELAVETYQAYWNTYGPSPDEGSYDDKLNALAGGMVGGVIEKDHRWLAVTLGGGKDKAGKLYKNLIKDKLDEQGSPLDLDRAAKEVYEDLYDRMGNAASNTGADGGKLMDVLEGYWEDQTGEEDADGLAREAYEEFKNESPPSEEESSQVDPDGKFDDKLNAVVAGLASGVDPDNDRVKPVTDDGVRDDYASLIYAKLEEQKANGDPTDLDAAYDEVNEAVLGRMGIGLSDHEDPDAALDEFKDYWEGDGRGDASGVAREAYAQYLRDNTVTDNPDYEDNLNALVTGFGGSVIDDTRTLSPLRDETLSALYRNLIRHKLEDGVELDEANTQVRDELDERLGNVFDDDTTDIVNGYFERHGGEKDAIDIATDAYGEHVKAGEDPDPDKDEDFDDINLLAPSATDIMNAETDDGETVYELYMKKVEDAYGDKPADSDEGRFLRLLQAKNGMAGMYNLLTSWNGNPSTEGTTATLTEAEFAGLVDDGKLEEAWEAISSKDAIAEDSERMLREAVGSIKDKKGLEDRIVKTMTSPKYKDELAEADEAIENGALQRFASDIRSLDLLNPERADQIQQELAFGGAMASLSEIVDKGFGEGGISEEDFKDSAKEIATTFVKSSVLALYGADAVTTLGPAFDKFVHGAKLDSIRLNGGEVLTESQRDQLKATKAAYDTAVDSLIKAYADAKAAGKGVEHISEYLQHDSKIQADLEGRLNNAKVDPATRSTAIEGMKKIMNSGALTTAGGLACIVAGTLALTNPEGGPSSDDKVSAAIYFLFTASGLPAAAKQITGGLEKLFKQPGMSDALGLDKSIKEGFQQFSPSKGGEHAKLWENANKLIEKSNTFVNDFEKLPDNYKNAINAKIDSLVKGGGKTFAYLKDAERLKVLGGAFKFLGGISYVAGGVLDTYLGIKGLVNAEPGSAEQITSGLTLGAGLAWTGGAVAGLAGASTLGVGLGAVGVVLTVIGLAINSALQYDKIKDAYGEQQQYWQDLDGYGVTKDEWETRLRYVEEVNLMIKHGLTDEWRDYLFPDDMAPWEAQPEHYEAWKEATADGGKTDQRWWSMMPEDLFPGMQGETYDLIYNNGHGKQPDGPIYKNLVVDD